MMLLSLLATVILLSKDVQAVSLSTNPDVTAAPLCPTTSVIFSCSAEQTSIIQWEVGGVEVRSFFPTDFNDVGRIFQMDSTFLVTLKSVSSESNGLADLTSTLQASIDEVENISCSSFSEMTTLFPIIASPPSPPSNVTVVTEDFQTESFLVTLSWDSQEDQLLDKYRISINGLVVSVGHNNGKHMFLGKYNDRITINISATNCAGESEAVTLDVYEAGCCNPISPFNGSVSRFTSARAGANITYLCGDTLELDGESIATCSSTSLQWEPSATAVRCIQPYSGHCTDPGPMVNGHIKKANETEEGSLMVFQCNAGFTLHSSSSTFQCRSGQWSIRPEDMMCTKTEVTIKPKNMTDSTGDSGLAAIISGVVCSVVFLSVGVLLGALLHHLICTPHTHTHSHKPSSPSPPIQYEEEKNVSSTHKASADIELSCNEAYGPVSQHHIPITHNPAYTHVQL